MNREYALKAAYDCGVAFETKYHGCAQCAVGALYDIFPELRNDDVFKAASALGGGVGLTCRGHCGGLTGGGMVLSQLCGRELSEIADPERKRDVAFALGEKLVQRFLDEYGTVICGDIHAKVMGRSFNLSDPVDKDAFENAGGHTTACPAVVGKSVRWAAALILDLKEDM